MFIQCQHCQATYKIDEHKIPDQNTFVRCVKCDTPISLNKQDQSALSKKQPHKIVDCSNCGTRYSIPLEKISDSTISVRCGKCSHVFQVSADTTEPEKPVSGKDSKAIHGSEEKTDTGGLDFREDMEEMFESESDEAMLEDNNLDLDNISIPKESEIEIDGLFDDVDAEEEDVTFDPPDELTDFMDPDLEDNEPDKGPTEAYLDSIKLSDQEEEELNIDNDPDLGDISSDDKYQLFLKPKAKNRSGESAAKQLEPQSGGWPDIQDETDSLDMDSELNEFIELDDLGEIPDSADYDSDDPLELREMGSKSRSNRVVIVALLVVLFVVLGVSGWFYFQTTPPPPQATQPVEIFNKQSRLKLMEPLKGHLIRNTNSQEKIFVLEGEIRNDYPPGTMITWIEVKGALYDSSQTVLSESIAYGGRTLSMDKLRSMSREELVAIRKTNSLPYNIELKTSEKVAFQILFLNVGDNIQKLQAQINRFSRKPVQ
ncbi:zinc-ribbon domain-containing protein [bacterium]|nr:zinc-ribbon domain-containing protein [bacterium]